LETLYRNSRRAVILAGLAIVLAQSAPTQVASRAKVDKGPRALGLVELAPNGGAHLIPIIIMIDGQFYDASAYKAAPVPMALGSGIVYEAERSGVSMGLFTVTAALQSQNKAQSQPWIGEGKWLPAGSKPPKTTERAESKPRGMEDDPDKPPTLLRRHPAETPKPADPAAQPTTPAVPPAPATPPVAAPPASTPAPAASAPSAPAPSTPAPTAPAPAPVAASAPPPVPPPDDNKGPVLRRGKWSPLPKDEPNHPLAAASTKPGAPASANPTAAKGAINATDNVQIIPAISDAGGPEPRPYTYGMKPAEQQQFQQKMLAMAADEVRARAKELAANAVGAPAAARTRPLPGKLAPQPKLPPPVFADVQLHVFDLSNSNEPVLVLTASAHLPPGRSSGPPGLQYLLTLVARDDIYGELHKAFSSVTDTQHLDVQARYDLIDAVDADGDGRGELLFRKVSDAGSAYALYRVIGNQLWPLFDGTPGQ